MEATMVFVNLKPIDREMIERANRLGVKLQWSPAREGLEWLLEGLWFLLVMDPEGGYWSVAPERKTGPDGNRDGPEGMLLARDKPEDLVAVLKKIGFPDVRLFGLEEVRKK